MKYLSLFSGIGGFEIPLQKTGYECVGYSEIDKYAIKVYERQFNEHKQYGDATTINAKELPDFDLLVGGFPCQAFSVAGKRQGFNDTRGTLFFDIARILSEKRPQHLVLENVKGLLSHDKGKTFQTILGVLSDLGYRVEWQILNSKDFGVPQNRERVFFVGHLRGECGGKVFPITGTTGKDIKVAGYLDSPTFQKRNESTRRIYEPDGVAPTIPTAQGGGVMAKIVVPRRRRTEFHTQDISSTLTSRFNGRPDGDGRPAVVQPVLTPNRPEKRQNGRRMKDNGEPSFTLTGQDQHGLYDGARIRRLTPKECERLQGFPDDWTALGVGDEPISDSQRYKMCGNAVTVNVVESVISKMVKEQCL